MLRRGDEVPEPDDDGPADERCLACENQALRRALRTMRRFVAVGTVALLIVGGSSVWGWIRQDDIDRHQDRSDAREAAEEEVEAANACISQWNRVAELRSVIERLSGAAAEAAVIAVGHIAINLYEPGSLPPDILDQLVIEADINSRAQAAEILQDYPDPECSLADAQARVNQAERDQGAGG